MQNVIDNLSFVKLSSSTDTTLISVRIETIVQLWCAIGDNGMVMFVDSS